MTTPPETAATVTPGELEQGKLGQADNNALYRVGTDELIADYLSLHETTARDRANAAYAAAMWNAAKRLAAHLGEKDELALAERLMNGGLVELVEAACECRPETTEERHDRLYAPGASGITRYPQIIKERYDRLVAALAALQEPTNV